MVQTALLKEKTLEVISLAARWFLRLPGQGANSEKRRLAES